jgi:hypothetical protein
MEFKKIKEIGHAIGLTSLFCESIDYKVIFLNNLFSQFNLKK